MTFFELEEAIQNLREEIRTYLRHDYSKLGHDFKGENKSDCVGTMKVNIGCLEAKLNELRNSL